MKNLYAWNVFLLQVEKYESIILGMEKSSSKLFMTTITTSTSKYVLCSCEKKEKENWLS